MLHQQSYFLQMENNTNDSIYSPNSLDDLKLLDSSTRYTFLWIYIIIVSLSIVGNCAAIYSISKRNYRIFQKACIISLAISDLLSTIAIATINMVNFAQEPMIWPLGSFLCSALPMFQMIGVLASSVALMFIAMDRYRNVVFALSRRWNPRLGFCLSGTITIWVVCFAVSYPMYTFYVVKEYPTDQGTYPCCITKATKETLRNYYISMVTIIFFPLFSVFLWFYYSIASLVWKHRKPISTIFNKNSRQEDSSSSSKSLSEVKNITKPKTQEDIRVGRKIRTFKIIIALMVVFISCRLPYFMVQILRTVDSVLTDMEALWHMIFAFQALHIVNCFLNPLLYTYLNVTLQVLLKIENFVLEVCCFCCSRTEFESFEKENPFVIGDYEKKRNSKVRFEDEEKY